MDLKSRYHRYEEMIIMKVAVLMGSDSDWPILKPAVELLKHFGIIDRKNTGDLPNAGRVYLWFLL